jgi:predicted HAD superfamily Cof-like phosphohydrolase
MSLDDSYLKVEQFHLAFGIPTSKSPKFLESHRVQSRSKWLLEEVEEFLRARDRVEQTDALRNWPKS